MSIIKLCAGNLGSLLRELSIGLREFLLKSGREPIWRNGFATED